jgi:peptide chain release factor subunit 1
MDKAEIETEQPEVLPRLKSSEPEIVQQATGGQFEPRLRRLDWPAIRHLVGLSFGPPVLSIYVDLDPGQSPTPRQRHAEVGSLTDEAERLVEALEDRDRKRLRPDVQAVRSWLLESPEWDDAARGVAIFVSGERKVFDVVKLAEPVPSLVAIEPTPSVGPLVAAVPSRALCVALVDRANARIFCGSEAGLAEIDQVGDDVHGQHDQGGWSQARYQRSVEDEVDKHLANVAADLFELHKQGGVGTLVIGSPKELLPRMVGRLHPYLQDVLLGGFEAGPKATDATEALAKACPLLEEDDRRRERELFERLRRELAIGGLATAGLPATLEALNRSRVDTMLLTRDLAEPGFVCPSCRWLGLDRADGVSECPVDGERLVAVSNVVDQALQRAILLAAAVWTVRFGNDLEGLGGTAALLRF